MPRFIHTDVAVASDLERMVQTAVEQFGGLDILVNDAIWSKGGTAVTLEEADWDRAIAVGLKACYVGAKYAVPAMARRGGGSIINISSVHGLLAARNSLVYESLKGGLILMTKEMASDFGPQGIPGQCDLSGDDRSRGASPPRSDQRERPLCGRAVPGATLRQSR